MRRKQASSDQLRSVAIDSGSNYAMGIGSSSSGIICIPQICSQNVISGRVGAFEANWKVLCGRRVPARANRAAYKCNRVTLNLAHGLGTALIV